jgi:DNA mismatch repair protein MutL
MPGECRIRILDEEVANKIAAGEVVERPASVVKELVENAIDAGAARILVDVEDGGKALIRVTDNGCGMTAQEAVLSLQRHATSKISRPEDLGYIRTLGFRGEALPSIASVSRLTVLTRARGETEGVRLECEAGEIRELEPAGTPEGTILAIRDLFHNVPARLKFLKTTRTELGQICDAVSRAALSHPQISFRLLSEGDEVLHAPGSADPLNTIAALYGSELAKELLPVSFGRTGLVVEGYVSRPSFTRPTRSGQQLFVNGRWIRNRTLTHALDEAFRSTLPGGRFPFALLHVEIDPALLDVNVHPTKSEVRFLRDWEVHRAVLDAVRQAIGAPPPGMNTPALARQHTLQPEDLKHGPWLPPPVEREAPLPEPPPLPTDAPAPNQLTMPELHPPLQALRAISQLWNAYILAEAPQGIVVIDQHLAHERVLFDRLQEKPETETQPLANPVSLQLTHREALGADEWLPHLNAIGFDLEAFGRDAFLVRAVPDFVRSGTELATLRRLLDDLAEARQTGGSAAAVPGKIVATAACKAAVKKGLRLGREEMDQILGDLSRSSNPHTCPHGCAIAVEIPFTELLRRFKRI